MLKFYLGIIKNIKKLDIFGYHASLNFDTKNSFKTYLGAIITILIATLMILAS